MLGRRCDQISCEVRTYSSFFQRSLISLSKHASPNLVNGCLEPNQYVTFPDNDGSVRCFQILQKRFSAITVQLDFSGEKHTKVYQWMIQPVEIWNSAGLPSDPLELNVFVLEDAQAVNILDWTDSRLSKRRNLRAWTLCQSDLDGCLVPN